MAEIINTRGRKSTPRIDFTPMVDLGFLLITFFVFTSSLNEPRTMDIQMPVEGGVVTKIKHYTAMTIYLADKHRLFYLTGSDAMKNDYTKMKNLSLKNGQELRDALLMHKENVRLCIESRVKGSDKDDFPFVIVKASQKSDYSDLVNTLDELSITGMLNYALVDISEEDEKAIAN